MTTPSTSHALVGVWSGRVSFTDGPRQGENEGVRLTFLPDGVIVGAGEVPVGRGQLPPAAGEWTAEGERFAYCLNAVLSDPSGRPTTVVHAHAQGTVAGDGRTLRASGGSDVYGPSGELLLTNRAELYATRMAAA
jgi:hypothetical protein